MRVHLRLFSNEADTLASLPCNNYEYWKVGKCHIGISTMKLRIADVMTQDVRVNNLRFWIRKFTALDVCFTIIIYPSGASPLVSVWNVFLLSDTLSNLNLMHFTSFDIWFRVDWYLSYPLSLGLFSRPFTKAGLSFFANLCDKKNTLLMKLRRNAINLEWEQLFQLINADLNPICHLLALLGAHHILHVSSIRVNFIVYRLIHNLMFFWPCIMNWLYINYQLDALIIIYS